MLRLATTVLAAAWVVLAAIGPATARARAAPDGGDGPATVVLEFTGRRATANRARVVHALASRTELVPVAAALEAARIEGADLGSAAGIARVAEATAVRLFVRGEVRDHGASERTRIHVLDESGNEIAYRDVASHGAEGARRLREAAISAFEQAKEQLALRDTAVALPEARPEPEPYATTEEAAPPAPGRAHRWPTLRLLAVAGARNRTARVDLVSGGRRRYESGFFSELGVLLEVRPFAASPSRAREPLCFDLSFAGALALSSTVRDSGATIATQAYRVQAQAGYLVPLGPVIVGPLVGFGLDRFHLAANPVMPGVDYPYARLAIAAAVQAYRSALAFRAELGGRFAFNAHDLDEAFGEDAKARGLDVSAGIFGSASFGLSYEATFRYVRYGLDFGGAAPDPATSGVDRGVEIVGALGWAVE